MVAQNITLRAHFDGRTIVPDEPVDLPRGKRLTVRVEVEAATPDDQPETDPAVIAERLRRLREITGMLKEVPRLPDEALRRESYYRDPSL